MGRGGTVEPSRFKFIEKPQKAATNQNKVSSCWLRTNVMFCFGAASKPMPATFSMRRTNPQVECLKSSKIDEQNLRKLREKRSRTRRRLQAYSRTLPHTQLHQRPKVANKSRNAVEAEQDAPIREVDAEKRKRHHGVSSRTALLSTPPSRLCNRTKLLRTSDAWACKGTCILVKLAIESSTYKRAAVIEDHRPNWQS